MEKFLQSKEEQAALKAAKDKLNAEVAANWHDEKYRQDKALELTDQIYWGFDNESLIEEMTTVYRLGAYDRAYLEEARGMRAFWTARGGDIEASSMYRQRAEVRQDQIAFRVGEFSDKLEANFAETAATLIELGQRRLESEIQRRVLSLFRAATPSAGTYSNYAQGAGVTLSAINTALRTVKDAPNPQGNVNDVVIIGRSLIVDRIMDELLGTSGAGSNFLLQSNEEFVKQGMLGNYRGANIVRLNNHQDETGASFFPANELYVVTKNAAHFYWFGGPKTKQWEDNNWYWNYQARQSVGCAVPYPARIYRYVDTSI
jgi:hypothetical protein